MDSLNLKEKNFDGELLLANPKSSEGREFRTSFDPFSWAFKKDEYDAFMINMGSIRMEKASEKKREVKFSEVEEDDISAKEVLRKLNEDSEKSEKEPFEVEEHFSEAIDEKDDIEEHIEEPVSEIKENTEEFSIPLKEEKIDETSEEHSDEFIEEKPENNLYECWENSSEERLWEDYTGSFGGTLSNYEIGDEISWGIIDSDNPKITDISGLEFPEDEEEEKEIFEDLNLSPMDEIVSNKDEVQEFSEVIEDKDVEIKEVTEDIENSEREVNNLEKLSEQSMEYDLLYPLTMDYTLEDLENVTFGDFTAVSVKEAEEECFLEDLSLNKEEYFEECADEEDSIIENDNEEPDIEEIDNAEIQDDDLQQFILSSNLEGVSEKNIKRVEKFEEKWQEIEDKIEIQDESVEDTESPNSLFYKNMEDAPLFGETEENEEDSLETDNQEKIIEDLHFVDEDEDLNDDFTIEDTGSIEDFFKEKEEKEESGLKELEGEFLNPQFIQEERDEEGRVKLGELDFSKNIEKKTETSKEKDNTLFKNELFDKILSEPSKTELERERAKKKETEEEDFIYPESTNIEKGENKDDKNNFFSMLENDNEDLKKSKWSETEVIPKTDSFYAMPKYGKNEKRVFDGAFELFYKIFGSLHETIVTKRFVATAALIFGYLLSILGAKMRGDAVSEGFITNPLFSLVDVDAVDVNFNLLTNIIFGVLYYSFNNLFALVGVWLISRITGLEIRLDMQESYARNKLAIFGVFLYQLVSLMTIALPLFVRLPILFVWFILVFLFLYSPYMRGEEPVSFIKGLLCVGIGYLFTALPFYILFKVSFDPLMFFRTIIQL